jgi:hypothetical protein
VASINTARSRTPDGSPLAATSAACCRAAWQHSAAPS